MSRGSCRHQEGAAYIIFARFIKKTNKQTNEVLYNETSYLFSESGRGKDINVAF